MSQIKKFNVPFTPCHACGHEYAGTHCPVCKTENPTFTAIKNIGKQADEQETLLTAVRLAGEIC